MRLIRFMAFYLLAAPAAAFDGGDIVEISVREGWRAEDGTHTAALHLRLKPGWKTYWRVPGEGGIPPRFDWSDSKNLAAAEARYPTPSVFDIFGFRTIGYEDEVIFPLLLRPEHAYAPIELAGTMDIGVCSDICVPVTFDVRSLLRPDNRITDRLIMSALNDRPEPAPPGSATCVIRPVDGGLSVAAKIQLPDHGRSETVVLEYPDPNIWAPDSSTTRSGDVVTAETEFLSVDGKPFPVERGAIRITVIGSLGVSEISGCPAV